MIWENGKDGEDMSRINTHEFCTTWTAFGFCLAFQFHRAYKKAQGRYYGLTIMIGPFTYRFMSMP